MQIENSFKSKHIRSKNNIRTLVSFKNIKLAFLQNCARQKNYRKRDSSNMVLSTNAKASAKMSILTFDSPYTWVDMGFALKIQDQKEENLQIWKFSVTIQRSFLITVRKIPYRTKQCRTKLFVGQNFRHLWKISSLLSDK